MEIANAGVLVVGATGVLGSRIAERLGDAGARLALTGRDVEKLTALSDRVGAVYPTSLDLVDVDAARTVVAAAVDRLGGLDALVIASGVAAFGPAVEDDDAVVEELFAVNTLGPMAVVRAALPHLGPGSVVAVLTAVLADVPTAGMAAYSASKAALSAYLTALRREVRRAGVTIFDIRPPHMDTGLADRPLAGEAPRMPPAHDVAEVVELIVTGLAEDRTELVADLQARTVSLG